MPGCEKSLDLLDKVTSKLMESKTESLITLAGNTYPFWQPCYFSPTQDSECDCHRVPCDWAMCVPPIFYPPLDINYASIRSKNSKKPVFVQGSAFSFNAGQTFYDTQRAYTEDWLQALQSIHMCVQIEHAVPAVPSMRKTKAFDWYPEQEEIQSFLQSVVPEPKSYEVKKEKKKVPKGGQRDKKESPEFEYRLHAYTTRIPGQVEIAILRPNSQKAKLERSERMAMSQDNFVRFLITGPK